MDSELVGEVFEVSGLMRRLREWWEYDTGHLVSESIASIEQLERELYQLTLEWKEEMELRMSVAQELRDEKALADSLAVQLFSYTTTEYWSDGDDDAIAAYRKARGL